MKKGIEQTLIDFIPHEINIIFQFDCLKQNEE